MKNRLNNLPIILILIILIAAGFVSCSDSPPSLSEYQGIDYILSHKFSSGSWVFDDTVQGSYHYMGFNSDETGVSAVPSISNFTGLPSAATGDVSRLEIFNLVSNGGFETSLTNWSASGATITTADGIPSVHNTAGNYSLHYVFNTTPPPNPDNVQFDLGSLKDSFLADKRYIIRLNFSREYINNDTLFRFNDERVWDVKAKTSWDLGYTKFPDAYSDNSEIVATSSSNSFYIIYGTHNIEGYIDDFRIVRSDISYNLKFTVPYSEAGRPDLYSGTYRLSVYIKAEDDADVTPNSPNENRFRSSRVSLGIGRTVDTVTVKGFDSSSFTSGSWTKISVEKFLQIRDGDSIELLISPADKSGGSNTLDIGSVLVAFPELYYVSD